MLLCASRRQLSRLPIAAGAITAVSGATVIALLGAAMLYVLDRNLGYGAIPAAVRRWQFATGSAAIAALITAVVLRYLYVIDGWQAQVRASARAQADALQARIKPHFLFNSMNTIAGLVRHDPILAERAVLDLSDLFRAALGAGETDRACARKSTWPSATLRSKPCAWAAPAGANGTASSRCHGRCRCHGWCCSH